LIEREGERERGRRERGEWREKVERRLSDKLNSFYDRKILG
jgi:hypothetical protein